MAACLVGLFSYDFFCFDIGGHWDFTIIGRIGHDALSTNKLVEAVIVLDHGVSSLLCVAVAVAAALGAAP